MIKPEMTRRQVVLAGGLGVAGAVAATLPDQTSAAPSLTGDAATRQRELRVLEGLLSIERVQDYAYRRVLRSSSINSSTRHVLELVLGHEGEHAAVLGQQAAALSAGLSPSARAAARPTGSSALSDVTSLLDDAQTPRDSVRVLTKVESLAEANYFNAVSELQSPDLALTAARILASEAQHWWLLLNVLTEGAMPESIPTAFIRGVGDLSAG